MKSKTHQLIADHWKVLCEQDMPPPPDPSMEAQPDIAAPDPNAPPPEESPQPMTSKGEEFLVKLAYLALLYTPKDDEVMNLKSAFESAGISSENDIRSNDPESIKKAKDIITSTVTTDNASDVAADLNTIR